MSTGKSHVKNYLSYNTIKIIETQFLMENTQTNNKNKNKNKTYLEW